MSERLFALIIGIDDYTIEASPLRGAVSDANKVLQWVSRVLRVPNTRILNLRNEKATRKAIISELKRLAENPCIHPNDPILIYYAGHGAEATAPNQWHWDSPKIQMILPYDYKHQDGPYRLVQGIPDRTLGYLLSEISKKKGDNITVVFDCCNSGSGTRSHSDSRVRGVLHDGSIPADLDDDLISPGTRGLDTLPQFRHHGLSSHVLLAACAPHERAHETKSSGEFTTAFLNALAHVDVTELTYKGLIERMERLKFQTPQCEGLHSNRILFDKKVPNTTAFLDATLNKQGKLTIDDAGAIHGIEPQSTFAIWASRNDIRKPPIEIVTVDKVGPYKSSAPSKQKAYGSKFIAQIKGNPKPKLAVYVPHVVQNLQCFQDLFKEEDGRTPVRILLAERETATIGLTYSKGMIGFEALKQGEEKQVIRHVIAPEVGELGRAIEHLSRFYHHRHRVNSKCPKVGVQGQLTPFSKFSLEVFKVVNKKDEDDMDGSVFFLQHGPNINLEGIGVEIIIEPWRTEPEPRDMYGFKINNHTEHISVFPHLFYFDSSDFSITCIYPPSTTQSNAEPPLQAGQSISIGYGSSGLVPPTLFLSDSTVDFELGHLSLYLSTKHVDLSSMVQDQISSQTRGIQLASMTTPELWDSICVPITIKRGEVTTPSRMIGVVGSRGNGKHAFLEELFKSLCGTRDLEPSFENQYIKEYTITLLEQSFTVVDLPAIQDDSPGNVDSHLSVLKATVSYLSAEHQRGREFLSLIWCYNITKPKYLAIDAINLNLVKDLAGQDFFERIIVLTTGWNRNAGMKTNNASTRAVVSAASPLQRYEKSEHSMRTRSQDWKELEEKGTEFKRFGVFSDAESAVCKSTTAAMSLIEPMPFVKDLLSKTPRPLQVQRDACETRRLTGTAAGKSFRDSIEKAIKQTREDIKELDKELVNMDENNRTRPEVQIEKKVAEQDLVRWGEILTEIGMVGSAFL